MRRKYQHPEFPERKTILLVSAPDCDPPDIEKLRAELRLAAADLHYNIICNFRVNIQTVEVPPRLGRLLISAEDATEPDLTQFRTEFELALRAKGNPYVLTHLPVTVQILPL